MSKNSQPNTNILNISKPKVYWHEHTHQELHELIPQLKVAVIPTGSTEIHGPHLGVGNDILSCMRVAEEVAVKMYPRAVVVNVLWVGVAPHNMTAAFPGTISLSATTYMRVLREAVESLVKHGIRKITLINGHGGNEAPNITACREIRETIYYQYGVDVEIGTLLYWDVIPEKVWDQVLEQEPQRKIGHGGEAETSILLAVAPRAVRLDLVRSPDSRPRPTPPFFRAWYQDEYSPDGHTDDAKAAHIDKGRKLLKAAVTGTVAALEDFITFRPVGTRSHPGRHLFPRPDS
jgi:creatinine amidohydrolase